MPSTTPATTPKTTDTAIRDYARELDNIHRALQHLHGQILEDIEDTEARLGALKEQLDQVNRRIRHPVEVH